MSDDDPTFEPVQAHEVQEATNQQTTGHEPPLSILFEWDTWRAPFGDAVRWLLAVALVSALAFGVVWGGDWIGVKTFDDQDFWFPGILMTSALAWLVSSLVASFLAWRAIESSGWLRWLHASWLVVVVGTAISGVVPMFVAGGGWGLAMVVAGPSSVFPGGGQLMWKLAQSVTVGAIGFGLVVLAGRVVSSLWERLRWPVLTGIGIGIGYALTVSSFVSGPDPELANDYVLGILLGEWVMGVGGAFVSVPVAALALWPVCTREIDDPNRFVRGFQYLLGVVFLWAGLEGVALGLHAIAATIGG